MTIEQMTLAELVERARELDAERISCIRIKLEREPNVVCVSADRRLHEINTMKADIATELTRRLTVEGEVGEVVRGLEKEAEAAMDADTNGVVCQHEADLAMRRASLLLTQAARIEELEKRIAEHEEHFERCVENARVDRMVYEGTDELLSKAESERDTLYAKVKELEREKFTAMGRAVDSERELAELRGKLPRYEDTGEVFVPNFDVAWIAGGGLPGAIGYYANKWGSMLLGEWSEKKFYSTQAAAEAANHGKAVEG